MRNATVALLLLPLNACIYYDGNGGDCDGDCWGWDDDTGWQDDDDTGDTSDTGSTDTGDTADTSDTNDTNDTNDTCDTDDTIPLALSLDPAEGAPCTTFIASLTDDNGLFDLSTTTDARFFGPVEVLAIVARTDEVLLSLAIDGDAAPGPVDLLVEFSDGSAAFAEGALTVTVGLTTPEDCLCPPAL